MSVLKNEKKGQGDGPKAVNIGTHRRPHPPPKSKSLFSSISLHAAGMINLKRTAGLWDDMYPHRSARSCHGANSSKSAFSVGFQSCFRWCEAWVGKDVYPRRVGMIRGRADRNSGSHGRDLHIDSDGFPWNTTSYKADRSFLQSPGLFLLRLSPLTRYV